MRQEEEEELVWLCTVSSLRNNIWVSGVVELSMHSNNIWYHCFTVLIHSHFIVGVGDLRRGNVFNIGCRLRADAVARRRGGLSRWHKVTTPAQAIATHHQKWLCYHRRGCFRGRRTHLCGAWRAPSRWRWRTTP